jgi:D-alanyl-lipoteichoic acid acyltransferase DltB (MBOAT superfamily)
MFFNSLTFFIFFGIVVCLYFALPHRWQNRMLLFASYFFYAWWDWRFLSLIMVCTVTEYLCGIQIYNQQSTQGKRTFLWISVITNLTLLGFFKYFNFFVGSSIVILSTLGIHANIATLHIILPLGISFYIFRSMSYSIDIYRCEMEPTHKFFDYALFVAFFPLLMAGPIERAKNLLPQIVNERHLDKDQILRGIQLIFWGLFKKVFVADNLAIIVDQVYKSSTATGAEYVIATWAFAIQIYSDFSGYTDIARGTSKCLGFKIMHNFKQPYFAINPSDHWRRWHISLTSWLRDYLYVPLGGNGKGTWITYRNIFVTMFLCGLWHGAAWNFVIWGAYHGILLSIYRIINSNKRSNSIAASSVWSYFLKAFIMFQLITVGFIFFRAQSVDQISIIFKSFLMLSLNLSQFISMLSEVVLFSALPILVMAFQTIRELRPSWFSEGTFLKNLELLHLPLPAKSIAYGILAYLLCLYGAKAQSFIYLQF